MEKKKNHNFKSLTAGSDCVSRWRCVGRTLGQGLQVGLHVGLNALETRLKGLLQLPLGFQLQGCTLEMHRALRGKILTFKTHFHLISYVIVIVIVLFSIKLIIK